MKLDPWQVEALEHKGNLLLKTGRQVGKTTIMSIKAAKRMVKEDKSRIIVCSLTEDQAQLMIVMVLDYLQKNHPKALLKGQKYNTKNKVVIRNGSQIIARPVGNTGDALRGFTGDVLILDEVSRFNELILTAATPILATTGGEIWACSTPFGKKGWFWESYKSSIGKEEGEGRFKVIECDTMKVYSERPINEDWTEEKKQKALEFLEEERKQKSKLEFGQEYMGLFVEDLQQFFSDELITTRQTLNRTNTNQNGIHYLGADIGGLGEDPSAITIFEEKNGRALQRECQTLRKKYTTEITDYIIHLKSIYNQRKEFIDDMGVGFGVFSELLANPKTSRSVEAINNSSRPLIRDDSRKKKILKEDLYFNLKKMMERGEIELLKDDEIFNSLKSIQLEIKEGGEFRFSGKDTHIAEAIIRAVAYKLQRKRLNNFNIHYI